MEAGAIEQCSGFREFLVVHGHGDEKLFIRVWHNLGLRFFGGFDDDHEAHGNLLM
jgi:hypothetical protein